MGRIEDLVSEGSKMMDELRFELALEFFEQALLLDQSNPDLWNNKGTALRSIGRHEKAMECFNKSLEIEPRDKRAS